MAFTLRIDAGSLGVNFLDKTQNPGFELMDEGFDIRPAETQEYWDGNFAANPMGIELVDTVYTGRKIEITFRLYGNSRNDLATGASTIKKIIRAARLRSATKLGDRAELRWQLDGMTNSMYFEIINGTLSLPRSIMSVLTHERDGSRYVIRNCVLELDVRPFAYIISPKNGTLTTIVSATAINNINDGTYDNFITTSAGTIIGDSPAPTQVEIDNDEVTALHRVYLCLSRGVTGASASAELPGLAGIYSSTIPAAGEIELAEVPEGVGTTKRGHYRLFGRATTSNTWDPDFYFSIKIRQYSGGTAGALVLEGPWVKGSNRQLQDLGTLYLPPWNADIGSMDNYLYELWIRGAVSDAYSLNLDTVMLAQIDGGYRVLTFQDPYLKQNVVAIDSAWSGQLYLDAGTYNFSNVQGFMQPLFLQGSEAQTLTVITEQAAASPEDHTITVALKAAPAFEVLA